EDIIKKPDIISYLRSRCDIGQSKLKALLVYLNNGLYLVQVTMENFLFISANFHGDTVKYRRQKGGGKNEMIAKAIGLNINTKLNILDATCGLGSDAFILASLGGHVTMIERVVEIHALVEDALMQAVEWGRFSDPKLLGILNRMKLIKAEAATHMPSIKRENRPDVVYLDPMFPPRKKSAKVKKEMNVLRNIVGSDSDSDQMLRIALNCALKRVVVKRPKSAKSIGYEKVNYTFKGKSNRYDVYLCN
ncbi:MAG: class I SAM-dependent methyltransferase, partial [Verrucomicrobiota bacterium]|nr:class I SAM-dependent methyltransferase [Verrucomicrobiota bacterium]